MSLLSEALNEYVAMRRNLGFVFREPASLLRTFVAFVDQAGSPFITTELARQWALQPTGAQPSTNSSEAGSLVRIGRVTDRGSLFQFDASLPPKALA